MTPRRVLCAVNGVLPRGVVDGSTAGQCFPPAARLLLKSSPCLDRSSLCWEGIHVTVDSNTSVKQLENTASYIVTAIKLRPKVFGGSYRIWISDSLPGNKLKISVWYNHNTNGVLSLHLPGMCP
jgi:hypothetical protein